MFALVKLRQRGERAGGWRDEQSPVRFNGTLADLKLTIYTHTYMQAQTLRCPGFFFFLSEERVT